MSDQDAQVTAAYSGRDEVYEASDAFKERAHISSMAEYEEMYQRSIENPEAFWDEQADRIDWFEPYDTVRDVSYEPRDVDINWYEGGVTNACYNAVDRHLDDKADQTALIFEPDDPREQATQHITYADLHREVSRFANVLKKQGVEKGDRVTIYLPMIPEAAYAMLACARIGAIHSVVFAGFSPDSLADRILDCESDYLITADEGRRGGGTVPLKDNADEALERCDRVETVLVVQHTGGDVDWTEGRDLWYHEEAETVSDECEPVPMDAEDPLFILYGEPINPEAWRWYYNVVGNGDCPIVDTWWQTETGGIMITPLPGAIPQKPGSASKPFFGIQPKIVNKAGDEQTGATEGILVIEDSWPGQMRSVYQNHERFQNTYFSQYPGHYYTGDGCRRDEDGYYWITGRVDDVLNVSGHRIGTAELESALVAHDDVAEAAVVGYPHEVKGQGIYAYVTLVQGVSDSEALREELVQHVRSQIGPIAKPDHIQFTSSLPKTRSGKIMRRIIRKIAAGEYDDLGDTSTLADPGVVESLIDERKGVDVQSG